MNLSLVDRIGSGGFADILAPPPGDRAYKLFRRAPTNADPRESERYFHSQLAAHQKAAATPQLRDHVPGCFGAIVVASITDEDRRDISNQYWLPLCYVMQRLTLDGSERKVADFYGGDEWSLMERFDRVFDEAGIDLGDASVLYWNTGRPVFIDFALQEGVWAN